MALEDDLELLLQQYGADAVLNVLGGGQPASPYTFGGDYEPELDPYAAELTGGFYDILPELTSKGALDPFDLTQQARALNFAQDVNTNLVDQALAMQLGPGAYDVGAFEPIIASRQLIEQRGRTRAQNIAQGGGMEAWVAQALLNGRQPSEIVNDIVDLLDPEGEAATRPTPEQRQIRDQILASVSPNFEVPSTNPSVIATQIATGGGPVGQLARGATAGQGGLATTPAQRVAQLYDLERIQNFATGLYDDLTADINPETMPTGPNQRVVQDVNGNWIMEETEPSPAAEWYQQRGLPLPTARYDDPEMLARIAPISEETLAAKAAKDTELSAAVDRARQRAQQAETEYQGITEDWEKFQRLLASGMEKVEAARARERDLSTGQKRKEELAGQAPVFDYSGLTEQELMRDMSVPMVTQYPGGRVTPGGQDIYRFARSIPVGGTLMPQGERRRITAGDVGRARRQQTTARQGIREAESAQRAYYNLNRGNPDWATSLGTAVGMAQAGRTPLQDAIALRLMGLRNTGAFG